MPINDYVALFTLVLEWAIALVLAIIKPSPILVLGLPTFNAHGANFFIFICVALHIEVATLDLLFCFHELIEKGK